ncbi:serine hydrolase domain-containing protein [Rhodanobacter geophilus]|uniref:Serine hydrolase domain-containing protein n=1 Tax=Rhodanobacter geophilus TaxID=3162488 RepID=A0ABV3QPA6_9GAMM
MSRPLRLFLCIFLSMFATAATAQIEIHPLAEKAPPKPTPLGARPLSADDAGAWLDGLMPYGLAKNDLAGAVVVIVKDGQVLLAKGYGNADVAADKPVDPASTLFRVGSISKLFTWTAVMQLVEQGKLDLDADVNRYLDFRIPPRDGQPVTLRELMTHTPGFEETIKNLFAGDPRHFLGNAAWVKEWVPERIYPPGRVPAYSNYGAALAGYIVQRVSGQPFDDYVGQHILQPLGMQYASFRQPLPAALAPHMARGYAQASAPPKPFELVNAAAAGALSASGEAMARFMLAQLQGGSYHGAQILAPATLRQMQDYSRAAVPGLHAMALGFYHMDRNGQEILGHGGDTQWFHSELALFPQQGVGVFVSIDGSDDGGLRKQLLDGFTDRYFPAPPEVPQPAPASARRDGALLVGRYANSRTSASSFMAMLGLLSQVRIEQDRNGELVTPGFRNPAGRPLHWREVAPFLWREVGGRDRLGARVEHGQVRWLSIDAVSPVMVFLPVSGLRSAGWNLPLLGAIVLLFALVALLWPVAALVRRACGKPFALAGRARLWYRLSRVAAIAQLLFYAGWVGVLMRIDASIAEMDSGFDGVLRLIQLFGVLAILGIAAAAMNAWHAWRVPGGWWRKLNSAALLAACLATLWFVGSLHLLVLHLDY